MKIFFSFLVIFLCCLQLEALEYPMFPWATLSSHKHSMNISTEILDAFVEKGLSSLCMIRNKNACGTSFGIGFFITPEGHLLTNKHVVESSTNLTAFLAYSQRVIKASIIAIHPTEDLAFLKITKPSDVNFSYLSISPNKEEIGNWVFCLRGRPIVNKANLLVLPSIGKIIGDLEFNSYETFSVLGMRITEGNSGSPVLNFKGKVIGVLSKRVETEESSVGCACAVSMHNMKPWIEDALHSDGYFEKLK